jgi:hypothetical protein
MYEKLENMCVAIAKHIQHPNRTLETNACNVHVMQHPDLLLQHPVETLEI